MNHLEQWFENCLKIKEEVLLDKSLQARIKEIESNGHYNKMRTYAEYTTLIPSRLGLKRRSKQLSMHKCETSLNGYLWTPDMPFSSFIVVVGETNSHLIYLMEDFSPLGGIEKYEHQEQVEKIKEYSNSNGVDLSHISAMAYSSVEKNGWNFFVHDLDPTNSFLGDFYSKYFSIFPINNSKSKIEKFQILHDIYERLISIEYRINLI
jgi:hypothetical protein